MKEAYSDKSLHLKRSQNNLILYLKEIEKEWSSKLNKTKAEISEIENSKAK